MSVTAGATASWASSESVRKVMRANVKRDTKPELNLRRLLHGMGLRYRVAARPPVLKGRIGMADVLFTSARTAVYLDGCWWHACPKHFRPARTNAAYWGPKIERNRARDSAVDAALAAAGWLSVRVWEHENMVAAARRVEQAVRQRRTK
jgi:DNA mismatch endonuclease (patch repair protein)